MTSLHGHRRARIADRALLAIDLAMASLVASKPCTTTAHDACRHDAEVFAGKAMRRIRYLIAAAAVAACGWLGLGWEQTSIDHEDRYLVFVKSYPSTKVIYRSFMGCDECDAPSFEKLAPDQKVEFTAFCRAKYGFDDPRICDAMFREQRRLNVERLSETGR